MKPLNQNAARRNDRALRASSQPRRGLLVIGCALALGSAGAVHADAVTDWNTVATQNTVLPLPAKLRAMAMVQIAVHDALNSIAPHYARYSIVPGAAANAIPEAAVAAAAHDVLVNVTPPAQYLAIETAYTNALIGLSGCPGSPACQSGIAAGQAAAAAILAGRSNDGAQNSPHLPYVLAPAPGVYQVTPNMPAPGVPAFANWANVRPFTMDDPTRFRILFRAPDSALRNLLSATYTVNYAQVKAFGSKAVRAASPNSGKSQAARFWYGSAGTDWATMTRGIVADRGLGLWEHARLFALLAISQADVPISVFEAKYHYNFWRPVTAIHWLDDGNPDTDPDPAWTPYLVTPPYPDYPCGTPMLAGAGTEVLRDFFGTDTLRWTATSNFPGQPGVPAGAVTRTYNTFSEAADQAAMARVYAGIHFGIGCHVGVDQGEKIGRYAFDNLLRPL